MQKTLLILGLLAVLTGCEKKYYVLDTLPTIRFEHLTVPAAAGVALRAVDFVSATEGYVGGVGGLLLHTTDAGRSWSATQLPQLGHINKLLFTSPTVGWAGTQHGLFQTTNGGQSWIKSSQLFRYPTPILDIQFVTSSVGYAVGGGNIAKTTNGGQTWQDLTPIQFSAYDTIRGVSFCSPDSGNLVGHNLARLRTSNGGLGWGRDFGSFSEPSNPSCYDVLRRRNGSIVTVGTQGLTEYASPQSKYPEQAGPYSYPVRALAQWGSRVVAVGDQCVVGRDPFSKAADADWVYLQGPDGATIRRYYLAADFADADTFYGVGKNGTITRFHY